MLRLARGGSETASDSVDGQGPVPVTSEMLGSRDDWHVGSYDLPLEPRQAASRSIAFSIPDDSEGDGEFGWDALALHGR